MGIQNSLLSILMRRRGSAVLLSITTSCKSIISLVSGASVKSVKLEFNEQSYREATSSAAITEVSGELNSDDSIADNTFLKEGVML